MRSIKAIVALLCFWLSGCSITSKPSVPEGLPTLGLSASSYSVSPVGSVVITVIAANALNVTLSGSDGTEYTLPAVGGRQNVTVSATTTYIATATGADGCVSAAILISAN